MTDGNEHEIEIPTNGIEQQMLEVLRQMTGAETYSEVFSDILEDQFGEIHPEAVENQEVDVDALLAGDLDPSDVPDEYKIGNYDAAGTEVSGDD